LRAMWCQWPVSAARNAVVVSELLAVAGWSPSRRAMSAGACPTRTSCGAREAATGQRF
jgi:hypothetical protein